MSTNSSNIVVKTTADKGNTVLFRTTGTGGTLQISLNGVQWFTVGGESTASGLAPYDFLAPLTVTPSGDVSVNVAVSDVVASGEPLRVVAVGHNTQKIGYNLLPDALQGFQHILDESGVILRTKLPADLVYTTDGVISVNLLPDNVALWDDNKIMSKDNLPSTVVYAVDGKIPEELLPGELFDSWEDYTNGVSV